MHLNLHCIRITYFLMALFSKIVMFWKIIFSVAVVSICHQLGLAKPKIYFIDPKELSSLPLKYVSHIKC